MTATSTSRLWVCDEAIERAVLAAVLLDETCHDAVLGDLQPSHFAIQAHRRIFGAMRELHRQHQAIDVRTVSSRVSDDEQMLAYVATMDVDLPDLSRLESYVSELRGYAVRRRLMTMAQRVIEHAPDPKVALVDIAESAEAMLLEAQREGSSESGSVTTRDLALLVDQMISTRQSAVRTGFADLDSMCLGLEPGHLWILAARPGMGKTLWAMTVAAHVAKTAPVAFASIEMPHVELMRRLLSAETGIPYRRLRTGALYGGDRERLNAAAKTLSEQPMLSVFDASRVSVGELASQARRMRNREGRLGLIVIDYLGLMERPRAEREDLALGMISTQLKQLAKDLEVPILALHQLNRALYERSDKRPLLGDLRGSGQLEQDADLVLFLHWPYYYERGEEVHGEKGERVLECIVAKNRHGKTGTVDLYWDPEIMRMSDLAKQRQIS